MSNSMQADAKKASSFISTCKHRLGLKLILISCECNKSVVVLFALVSFSLNKNMQFWVIGMLCWKVK